MPRADTPSTIDAMLVLEQAWLHVLHAPERAVAIAEAWVGAHDAAPSAASLFAGVVLAAARGRSTDRRPLHEQLDRVLASVRRRHLPAADATRLTALANGVKGMLYTIDRDLARALACLEAALALAPALPPVDRHCLHVWRAVTQMALAKPELAFRDFFAEYEYVRTHHPPIFAMLLLNIGAVLLHAGDFDGAEASLQQALESEQLVEIRGFGVVCRVNLAYCWIQTGRRERAREIVAGLLADDRDFLLRRHPGDVLASVAEDLIQTGFLEEADLYLKDLLDDARARGFRLGMATGTWVAGSLAYARGQVAEAAHHWRAALLMLRRLDHLPHLWKTMRALSDLYAHLGDWRRALRWHRRFHAAHARWAAASQPARLAYARAALELRIIREQAIHDPMTGLLNRRELLSRLEQLIEDSRHSGHPLAVAMIDLDNLKPINDRYGHRTGDDAIRFAAERLRATTPPGALLFRYGGDEFCALLPGYARAQATRLLASYLDALRSWPNPAASERRSLLTVSVGLAEFEIRNTSADALLDAADTALYLAKRAGGNRIA